MIRRKSTAIIIALILFQKLTNATTLAETLLCNRSRTIMNWACECFTVPDGRNSVIQRVYSILSLTFISAEPNTKMDRSWSLIRKCFCFNNLSRKYLKVILVRGGVQQFFLWKKNDKQVDPHTHNYKSSLLYHKMYNSDKVPSIMLQLN